MTAHPILSSLVLAFGLSVAVHAQGVGSQLPDDLDIEGYAKIGAESWDDFYGRAVLIEFFAYW